MTDRDEFAKAALTGLLAHPDRDLSLEEDVHDAYGYADAMLKAGRCKRFDSTNHQCVHRGGHDTDHDFGPQEPQPQNGERHKDGSHCINAACGRAHVVFLSEPK